MKSSLAIGDAAARFGLPAHVLRHWESMGLLAPERVGGDRRRYGPADLERVAMILRAKDGGLGLGDIAVMLGADRRVRREVLGRNREELRARIAAARDSLALVECALACEHEDIAACPHFKAMIAGRLGDPRPPRAPVPCDAEAPARSG
ncbi:helix-turn-helix domain-containing protein [Phytomonospora endophytica]|uniref:DNA-binding transcriptional MerR regulator n=1 Tax=Phytomonospora endophytica TaxID=714109 RepID=A0A841FUB0_9ACTN|nr:MerR family transcriptional regulator [Phytomonospora endophytica]MBB6035550.1 DNA-binding transcriptional MerR regulator [Phytomonospora endophytica]